MRILITQDFCGAGKFFMIAGMETALIKAAETRLWRAALMPFARVDVCQMPEYHVAYSGRIKGSEPLMWRCEDGERSFCYPFLLTPVAIGGAKTDYVDISSIYGYSGPLSTTDDPAFLKNAWVAFDQWAAKKKVIAEFTRFSLYADNRDMAHPGTRVEFNRPSAVSRLPGSEEALLAALGKKTRNMIRKAEKAGLRARELVPEDGVAAFRSLYEETMDRNEASEFFLYDDTYYGLLLSLPAGELRLFGVFDGRNMVAAAMALVHKNGALYHLGASLPAYAKSGAGNLSMFAMSRTLMESGVEFLTVGGGRTTKKDDPLFRFKKNNAMDTGKFYIGKRIVDPKGYDDVMKKWQAFHKQDINSSMLIFYR